MQSLLLLHGAVGAASQLVSLQKQLSNNYDVHVLNFSGHGGEAMREESFSISLFAEEVRQYIDQKQLSKVGIFGYSMGGYVAMYFAKSYPDKVNRVITLATKFHWDEKIAAREIQQLNPEKIAAKVPAFTATLKERHAPNSWETVLEKTATMLTALGKHNALQPDDYKNIETPCLVLLGDRDKMVTLEETIQTYKALPNAQMGVLPGTPHPVEQVNISMLSATIDIFLSSALA